MLPDLFVNLLRVHCGVFINTKDVEIETFDTWNVFQVRVYRWSRNTSGCGTELFRDQQWKEHCHAILNLFEVTGSRESWRWAWEYDYTVDRECVPGYCFIIAKERHNHEN
jgi:hypothetical protein